ncbi:MAG: hypothetical protein AABY32_01970 [Nanoarchaeota archaeon]
MDKATCYYWESESDHGNVYASSDEEAINITKENANLVIIYKESKTDDGLPFITVWKCQN